MARGRPVTGRPRSPAGWSGHLPHAPQLARVVLRPLQPAGRPVYPAGRPAHRTQVGNLTITAGLGQQFALPRCWIVG
jgi:hypothetical protein